MEIYDRLDDSIAVLTLVGRLTVTDAPGRLKTAATHALARGAHVVALDLSQVPYIDSTRLGELIATHISVAKQNGRLMLVAPPTRITALLRLAGLEEVFEVYESLDAARRALSA